MSANDPPTVGLGDWVHVGHPGRDAVVCHIRTPKDIEVVYLDDRDRAINEDAVWHDGTWGFKHSGPTGGYADKSDRLRHYVSILRQGRLHRGF